MNIESLSNKGDSKPTLSSNATFPNFLKDILKPFEVTLKPFGKSLSAILERMEDFALFLFQITEIIFVLFLFANSYFFFFLVRNYQYTILSKIQELNLYLSLNHKD